MKKLLIIQKDDPYFLFETLQVIEKNHTAFKEFDCTILVDATALSIIHDRTSPVIKGITSDSGEALKKEYDISVNLSLKEESWDFHGIVHSRIKIGPYRQEGHVWVQDVWSSYLMTLKAKAPFLTFHLQDIYKNILGIKRTNYSEDYQGTIGAIAYGTTSTKIFAAEEQENFIQELAIRYPRIPLKDISEIDLVSDVSHTLYIGPCTLDALKFAEAGGRGIFLSSHFQGFNLLPYSGGHIFLSSRGEQFSSINLMKVIEQEISNNDQPYETVYSCYKIDHENIFGAYLKSSNRSDDNYPFYQSHVVLWNFLLNLFETNLTITKCGDSQIELLSTNKEVLSKLLRLHDYAMASIDTIYHETKSGKPDTQKIEGHINNLIEMEQLTDQIAQTNSLLRPVLDFYRIRRGQNTGSTLLAQSQNSFLTYSEEHQALEALLELFSVTLKKNEVSI